MRIVVFVFFGVWTIPSVLPAGLPSAMERETENGCPSPKSARLGMMLQPSPANCGPCWKHAMAKVGISPCPGFGITECGCDML